MEPSQTLERVIRGIAGRRSMSVGMRTMMERESDFPDKLSAQLTGIFLDPNSAELADSLLDEEWRDRSSSVRTNAYYKNYDEVIIGSGFHAATYAATRVLAGFTRPLVIEMNDRVGGVFSYNRPVFYLNSRTRKGSAGLSGDSMANLNFLPGAPIQSANLAVGEYQTNVDMARVIRLTLAQFADVLPKYALGEVYRDGRELTLEFNNGFSTNTRRIIDARGLGMPKDANLSNETSILTFGQFMQKMTDKWPLRGIESAAVIGGGDSARCAVESLLGIGPSPMMGSFLDTVPRVDMYGPDLATEFDTWCRIERGRYRAIGQFLKPDQFGKKRLTVFNERVTPVNLPNQKPLISGRSYDLIVLATGNELPRITGLGDGGFFNFTLPNVGSDPLCLKAESQEIYRIGPAARLPFTTSERRAGINRVNNNQVAMFRLSGKTATLAAKLPTASGNVF